MDEHILNIPNLIELVKTLTNLQNKSIANKKSFNKYFFNELMVDFSSYKNLEGISSSNLVQIFKAN